MTQRDEKRGVLDQWRKENEAGSEHLPVQDWLKRYILGATMLQTSAGSESDSDKGDGKHVSNPDDQKSSREKYNDFKGLIADVNKARLKSEFASDFPDIADLLNEIEGIDEIYEEILNKLGLRPIMGQVLQCIMELTGIPQGLGAICKYTIGLIPTEEIFKIFVRQSQGGWVPDPLMYGLDAAMNAIPPNLNKELKAEQQRNEIDKFIKQLEEFLDFEQLCKDIEDLAAKLPDTLMSPGGVKGAENDINGTVPVIPEPPALVFPEELPTDDLEKAIMADIRASAKKAVMEALQEGITTILRLVLKYCRQAVEDLWGADDDRTGPSSPSGINDLLEDSLEDATPLGLETPLPQIYRGALSRGGMPDAGLNDDDLKGLMSRLGDALSPKQLCDLLYGDGSDRAIRIVKQVIMAHKKYYEALAPELLEKENIIALFKELGLFINRDLCEEAVELSRQKVRAKLERASKKPDPCPPGQDSSAGGSSGGIPSEEGEELEDPSDEDESLSDQQIRDILDDAFDDLETMSELFNRDPENLLQDSLPPMFCTENQEGLFPKVVEQDRMNNQRMVDSMWKSIDDEFAVESIVYLNVFKVSEDSEITIPSYHQDAEYDEDSGEVGDLRTVRKIEKKPFKIWHSFPTLKKSCQKATQWIQDRDTSHAYLDPPIFNFEDHNKLYGGMVSQGSTYAFKQENVVQRAVMLEGEGVEGGHADRVSEIQFPDSATGEPMEGFENPAELKLPMFVGETTISDVMTYHVPAMWNLVKYGGIPTNNKYILSLYTPVLEPVLGKVEGAASSVPLPVEYNRKLELTYYKNISTHLKTDVLEAIERVMPYTYTSPGIDLKVYMGPGVEQAIEEAKSSQNMVDEFLDKKVHTEDPALGQNPGTAALGTSEGILTNEVSEGAITTSPLEFLDADEAFNALKSITNSKDVLTEVLDKLIAARAAIRQYGRSYWAVATIPYATGKQSDVDYQLNLTKKHADDGGNYNSADSVWYGQDTTNWDPADQNPAHNFLPYDYNLSGFGFGGLPDRNWDGTPLGLLLKDLPMPVGPNYYEYPYAPKPCQDQPDQVFEDGSTMPMPPLCPDVDDQPLGWVQQPIKLLEYGYGWDLGGEGTYIAPAAVILESFMGLSSDFFEDWTYENDVAKSLVLHDLDTINMLEHCRGRLTPIVKGDYDPGTMDPRVLSTFMGPQSQNSPIYEKYGTIRTFFDLFRIYIKEINDPQNLYERLKLIKLKLAEFNSGGPLASESGSAIHNYYLSMKLQLISKIKDAIEAGEVDEQIVTHTFQARTYAKLAAEKWAKVMTSMPEGEVKEAVSWIELNEMFDEKGDWYKTWAGVHWEEMTEWFLEKVMFRIGSSRYFNVRELDKVSLIGEGSKITAGEDCGPPNYGQAAPPKPSVLNVEEIKLAVVDGIEKAICKQNYPQESAKALGGGLLITLIRLYVIEYAMQGIFPISMFSFKELTRNKLFLDYYIQTITDDMFKRNPAFYDLFLDHCSEMIDERLQAQAKYELEIDRLNHAMSVLEEYHPKDGQAILVGLVISSISDQRRAKDKINSEISKRQVELDKVKIIDPLTGGMPIQKSLKELLPILPAGADTEELQQAQTDIRAAKKERVIYLLVSEITNLTAEINKRIAKKTFPSMAEMAVNWLKYNSLGKQGQEDYDNKGANNYLAKSGWVNSMPKVSDKNVYDMIPGLMTSDPDSMIHNNIGGVSTKGETKLYTSPQILADGTDLKEHNLYDDTLVLTLSPNVKRVLDSNRRYFKDGGLHALLKGEDYDEMASYFDGATIESYFEWSTAMSKVAESGVYYDPEVEGSKQLEGDDPGLGGIKGILAPRGQKVKDRGQLTLQPYLHIERSAGYPTAEKIQNETDPDKKQKMVTDLHYIQSLRSKIEWGSGKIPEFALDELTGNLFIKGEEGLLNKLENQYFFLKGVGSAVQQQITSSDIELCLTFPFIEGPHHVGRGQLLIALLMDGVTSNLVGLEFTDQFQNMYGAGSDYHGLGGQFKDYFTVSYGMRMVQVDPIDSADSSDPDLSRDTPNKGKRKLSDIGAGHEILEKALSENNNTNVSNGFRAENSYRCREVHQINQLSMYRYDTYTIGEGEEAQTVDTMLGKSGNDDPEVYDTSVDGSNPYAITSIKTIYETPLADARIPISEADLEVFLFQLILCRNAPEVVSESPDYFYTPDRASFFEDDRRRGTLEEYAVAMNGHLFKVFENPSFGVYKKLREKLIETDEFKILFEYIFPLDRYLGLCSIYCTHSARINFDDIEDRYAGTKKVIMGHYLSIIQGLTDPGYRNPELIAMADQYLDSQKKSGGADKGPGSPSDSELLMRGMMLIVGAVARFMSPALATAEEIYKLIGSFIQEDENKPPYYPTLPLLKMALLPSPMFPPPPAFPSQTVLPMDTYGLGIGYLMSGVIPEAYKRWGVKKDKDSKSLDDPDTATEGTDIGSCLFPPNASSECRKRLQYLYDRIKYDLDSSNESPPMSIAEMQELAVLQAGGGICAQDPQATAETNSQLDQVTSLDGTQVTQEDTPGGTLIGEMSLQQIMNEMSVAGQEIDLSKITDMLAGKVGSEEFLANTGDAAATGGSPVTQQEDQYSGPDDDKKDFNF